jgi:hypothetical protein
MKNANDRIIPNRSSSSIKEIELTWSRVPGAVGVRRSEWNRKKTGLVNQHKEKERSRAHTNFSYNLTNYEESKN